MNGILTNCTKNSKRNNIWTNTKCIHSNNILTNVICTHSWSNYICENGICINNIRENYIGTDGIWNKRFHFLMFAVPLLNTGSLCRQYWLDFIHFISIKQAEFRLKGITIQMEHNGFFTTRSNGHIPKSTCPKVNHLSCNDLDQLQIFALTKHSLL